MTEQEVIKLMLDSMNNDNRAMAEQMGMGPDEIEHSISQSQPGLEFMLTNIYQKLKENNIIFSHQSDKDIVRNTSF